MQKQELITEFDQAPDLEWSQALSENPPFARVRVRGHYDTTWHLLLDNKILDGRTGVHVLSLFRPDQGQAVLVNRGWLPLPPDRSTLPEVSTPSGSLWISGILGTPVQGGIRLGEPQPLHVLEGSILTTYLDLDLVNQALDGILLPRLLQLSASDPTGFDGRNWQPAVILPSQHGAYAVQWFALALAMCIIWLALGFARGNRA